MVKSSAVLLTMILCAAAGEASAAEAPHFARPGEFRGYAPPAPKANWAAPKPPAPARPKSYVAPPIPEAPAFRPFKGTHIDSPRGGLDAYPAARKPKGGFSTYGR